MAEGTNSSGTLKTVGAVTFGAVVIVLLQFGLIGKQAEKAALERQESYYVLKTDIMQIQTQLTSIQVELLKTNEKRWTSDNMLIYNLELERNNNGNILVPDVKGIVRDRK